MELLPIDQLKLESFSGLLHTSFRVCGLAGGSVELELVEATVGRSSQADRSAGSAVRQESFSLVFRGPSQPSLSQGIYRFEHDRLGRCELFTVPVGPGPEGLYYQVVFNRLIRPA